jgi:hypothetical protein
MSIQDCTQPSWTEKGEENWKLKAQLTKIAHNLLGQNTIWQIINVKFSVTLLESYATLDT